MYDSDPHVYMSLITPADLDFSENQSLAHYPLYDDIVPLQHQQSMTTYVPYHFFNKYDLSLPMAYQSDHYSLLRPYHWLSLAMRLSKMH